jgi:hypothetical protein
MAIKINKLFDSFEGKIISFGNGNIFATSF